MADTAHGATAAGKAAPNPVTRATGPVWAADRVERWPIGRLTPYANNARTHSPAQIRQIADSMRQWGWTMPCLVDEAGMLLAGHARVAAAKLLEFREVPVMVAVGWSEAQKRAYVLADNQLALNAGWDSALLSGELSFLKDANFKLTLIGFSGADLRQYLNGGGLTDPDYAPPAPAVPKSKLGDLWLLGEHRLICGDATDAATVSRLLGGSAPHMMVTDPPYGVDYDPEWRRGFSRGGGGGDLAVGRVLNDHSANWGEAWALFPGTVCYVWHGGLHAGVVQNSLAGAGFRVRAQIIWVKQRPVISRGHFHWQHEPAFYAVKPGEDDHWRFEETHEVAAYAARDGVGGAHWQGSRKQSSVWFIEHVKSETGHGTQKPVEAMRRPILNNSDEGDSVYEPFSGSGTTIVAAEMTARRCFAVELDPVYVDVAVARWEQFTGRAAALEARGHG